MTTLGIRRLKASSRRLVIALCSALVLMLILPVQSASAHAYLQDSNPRDGASLTASPAELVLDFSEQVVVGATELDLADSAGVHYPLRQLRLVTEAGAGTEEPAQLFAQLPALPHSAYRLRWRTLSRDDLHQTSGVIVFGIGARVVAAGQAEPRPLPTEVALRWLIFLGLALVLGGSLARRLLRRQPLSSQPVARALKLSLAGAGVAAIAGLILPIAQLRSSSAGIGAMFQGRYGQGWLSREAASLLLVLLLLAALRGAAGAAGIGHQLRLARRHSRVEVAIALLGGVAILGNAMVGHNGAAGGLRLLADAGHVGAAAVWSGGLLVLLLSSWAGQSDRGRTPMLRRALIDFGRPAAGCIAVMVATGLYLTSGVAVSIDALLLTFYGRVLLAKLALFGLVAVLGMANHRWLREQGRRLQTRILVTEAAAGLVVLALAAVLTSSQPAREASFVRAAAASETEVSASAADLQQSLSIGPSRPGRNLIILQVAQTRRPAPGPVTAVTMTVVGAGGRSSGPLAATPVDADHWSVAVELAAGRTSVLVVVRRAGLADVAHDFSWTVRGSPVAVHRTVISNAPWQQGLSYAGVLAMAAVLLALLSSLVHLGARRRKTADETVGPIDDPTNTHREMATSGAD
jgi:putative copper export protein/methionine-rich copper-binding protein CopC